MVFTTGPSRTWAANAAFEAGGAEVAAAAGGSGRQLFSARGFLGIRGGDRPHESKQASLSTLMTSFREFSQAVGVLGLGSGYR